MKYIDRFLNGLTMYRVVIYGLGLLVLNSIIASLTGKLGYSVLALSLSLGVLLLVGYVAHIIFEKLFKAPANIESTIITALILFFVLAPGSSFSELSGLALAVFIAVASKYILVYKNIHIFNPAALAALIVGVTSMAFAFWWIATPSLLPLTIIVGLLIVRKINRFDLFIATIVTSFVATVVIGLIDDVTIATALWRHLASWPIIFFAAIMVTEPLSTPPQRKQRLMYGALIGIVSNIPIHFGGSVFNSPELTLLAANLFSFMTTLKQRLVLSLVEKKEIAKDVWEFSFRLTQPITFTPGQYLEWVLPHTASDSRGVKRYFTIASSPTENELKIAVKVPEKNPSSFKKQLLNLESKDLVYASQLAGDFVLPKDVSKELVFIAGGIGVTPFRSMIQYLTDIKEQRTITLFYLCNDEQELAYRDLFEGAGSIGLTIVPIIGEYLTEELLQKQLENIAEKYYYISGPPGMVDAYELLCRNAGTPRSHIKTDYFPGFA